MPPVIFMMAILLCAPGDCAVRVLDGDTMQIGEVRVRLWGIDAPELPSPSGRQARAAMRRLVDGRPVRCEPVGRDRYGRTVARCFAGDVDLGAAMIRAGKARPYCRYSGDFYDAAAVAGKRRVCGK
jgi:endonuclease YncB( thermonuclease family)